MEENKEKLPEASIQETEESVKFTIDPIAIPYAAGEEASDINGNAVDGTGFEFVQQDKAIHDVKFTTKPTTFMRDAFRRFRKNRSSVVGGIILGMLFLLALILPIEGLLPYDTKNAHNYETNLPMKITNPTKGKNSGFWNGTKLFKNSPYPYDDEIGDRSGNYVGEYADDSAIVSLTNFHQGFINKASERGTGGYARVYKKAGEGTGYLFCKDYTYSLANKYSVSYTLGWNEEDHSVAQPEYALFVRFKNDNADGIKNFALTDYTSDYGTLQAKENEEANIASYETVTIDNVSELITAAKNNAENKITDSMIKGGFSLGLIFKAKKEKPTALYVQNFGLTSNKASEAAAMNARSFGTSKAKMADANAMINVVLAGDTSSNSYWAAASDEQFNSYDTKSYTCDIRYDMYELAYGWRNDLPPVASSVFENWMGYREEAVLDENGKEQLDEDGHIITKSVLHEDLKLIDYTSVEEIQVGELKLTELGKNSDEVYIRSIEEIKTDLDPNDASKKIYSFRCTALAYKYLGYKTMPIHIFGTERQGKDLLKFVFSGLRTSLMLGVIVALINITIGIIWGSICGYFGGLTDLMMERFTDILSGIPWIVLMTVLSIKLGQNFGVFALALCLTGWIGTASITRSQFYRYKNREYVLASRTLGAKSARLIFRHILPNAIGTIVTSSVLMVPSVIFSEATISFLGLGLQNVDSLGVILSRAEANFATYPYQLIIPSIIISLLMICFNLFGNGLRDAFNPSLKGSE